MTGFSLTDAPTRRYQHLDWDSDRWRGFQPRDGDIYVCTCYKSGTTWTQMIAALLVFQSPSLPGRLSELSPWLDLVTDTAAAEQARLAAQSHRRILKTHTPLDGLRYHAGAKYLYVARDPRDVFVSLMNHQANLNKETERAMAAEMGQTQTVTDMLAPDVETQLEEWLTRGFFDWESDGYPWWSLFHHGETFWQHRHRDNILLLRYGDMKADLAGEMRRIAGFLDIEIAEETFDSLVEAASFSSMKKNADALAPAAEVDMWNDNSRFFNKGESGQWAEVWSAANLRRLHALSKRYPSDFIDWLMGSDR